jgi:hypothetical protein
MNYNELRPMIKTGAVVLWKGNGLISRAIRLKTEYSHISIVVRFADKGLDQRVFIVESLGSGLELRYLSKRVQEYNGDCWIYHTDITDNQRGIIRAFALKEVSEAKSYDYKTFWKLLIGRASQEMSSYICSEFVKQCFIEAKVVKDDGTAPYPVDLLGLVPGILRQTKIEV